MVFSFKFSAVFGITLQFDIIGVADILFSSYVVEKLQVRAQSRFASIPYNIIFG